MGRGGQKIDAKNTERRCIATGQTYAKSELIRFVLDPDNTVIPDISGRLPGRGIWVLANQSDLKSAIAQKKFAKSAKQQAVAPETLLELTEQLLAKKTIDLISMARKSGHAVCGFEKTKTALYSGNRHILIQAFDGSVPQKNKIRQPIATDPYISCLSSQELGLAFGRENVIHAAVSKGGLSARILLEANRLAGFRTINENSVSKNAEITSAAKG